MKFARYAELNSDASLHGTIEVTVITVTMD